jgi:hypothetical protein
MRIFLGQWCAAIAIVVLWLGCATTEPMRVEAIRVGSGGGVTGMRSGYRIERSGMIEQWEMLRDSIRIGAAAKLPASSIRDLFVRAAQLGADTLRLDHVGNMTHWLELTTGSGTVRLRWTDTDAIPPALAALYRDLRDRCRAAIEGK